MEIGSPAHPMAVIIVPGCIPRPDQHWKCENRGLAGAPRHDEHAIQQLADHLLHILLGFRASDERHAKALPPKNLHPHHHYPLGKPLCRSVKIP